MVISKVQQQLIADIIQHEKDIKWFSQFDYAKIIVKDISVDIEDKKSQLEKSGIYLEGDE